MRLFVHAAFVMAVWGGLALGDGVELRNGGLESPGTDGMPSGWRRFGKSPARSTGDGVHGGSAAFYCDVTDGDAVYSRCGGICQVLQYLDPAEQTMEPVHFGGWSRCVDAYGDYCLHLDVTYSDGTASYMNIAPFRNGTHGWERTEKVFYPKKPVKTLNFYAFLRKGQGKAWFDDLFLKRGDPGPIVLSTRRMTRRPFLEGDCLVLLLPKPFAWTSVASDGTRGSGEGSVYAEVPIPRSAGTVTVVLRDGAKERKDTFSFSESSLASSPLPPDDVAVWTAGPACKVTPLTWPAVADLPAKPVALDVAQRGAASAQVLVTTGEKSVLDGVVLEMAALKDASGRPFKGSVKWERIGYIRRQPDGSSHPLAPNAEEMWLPDPLLPAAPFKVRAGSTQGTWITATADADACPGVYAGEISVAVAGKVLGRIPLEVRVRRFSLPATFGMNMSFSVMDGFTRAWFPDRFVEMKRRSHDIMLDHRLSPDDISRTSLPEIGDLLHAKARGMNHFNILNLVPPPASSNILWVCAADPEDVFTQSFMDYLLRTLRPYVAELRKHGLADMAYLYGFDEREKVYYKGIDKMWKTLKREFPEIPLFTTARMYRDMATGKKGIDEPDCLTTDWFCPLTTSWKPSLTDQLKAHGRKVWWYTCCGPVYPYANFASIEYPAIEARLLGWMTHLYRADGFLFWHVNCWKRGERVADDDTWSPAWRMFSSLRVQGDGVLLYPGEKDVYPSIRLAAVRDAVQDYELLCLAERKAGRDAVDGVSRTIIRSLDNFERDSMHVMETRAKVVRLVESSNGQGDER